MAENIYKDMADYINLTEGLLKEAASKPVFKEEALQKTAEALSAANVIKADERGTIVDLFRQQPDKALESLQKLAELINVGSAGSSSLGAPANAPGAMSRSSGTMKASDRALFSKLGLI